MLFESSNKILIDPLLKFLKFLLFKLKLMFDSFLLVENLLFGHFSLRPTPGPPALIPSINNIGTFLFFPLLLIILPQLIGDIRDGRTSRCSKILLTFISNCNSINNLNAICFRTLFCLISDIGQVATNHKSVADFNSPSVVLRDLQQGLGQEHSDATPERFGWLDVGQVLLHELNSFLVNLMQSHIWFQILLDYLRQSDHLLICRFLLLSWVYQQSSRHIGVEALV